MTDSLRLDSQGMTPGQMETWEARTVFLSFFFKGKVPTSWRPLLAHSRHTIGGPPGTEVSTLRPPMSHTFSRSQSSWVREEDRIGKQPGAQVGSMLKAAYS